MGCLKRLITAGCGVTRSAQGLCDGRLAACSRAPCCVSTVAQSPSRRVAPIGYAVSRAEVHAILVDVLGAWPRTGIVTVQDDYIHVVQRSRCFRFVDDLECHLPADERLVHMRSAARIGWYDFGVNRARVERLRRAVNQRLAVIR